MNVSHVSQTNCIVFLITWQIYVQFDMVGLHCKLSSKFHANINMLETVFYINVIFVVFVFYEQKE
jgi:hypothetical protein